MRRREYYWSLFHRPAKNQLDDLRTDQIEAVYAAVPKSRHGEYLIWKEGFASWKPFGDFPEILISLRTAPQKHEPAPVPGNQAQTDPEISILSVPESASIHLTKEKSANSTSTKQHDTSKTQSNALKSSKVKNGDPHFHANVNHADSDVKKETATAAKAVAAVAREAGVADGKVIILGGSVQRGGAADPLNEQNSHSRDDTSLDETGLSHVTGANLQTSSSYVFIPKDVSKIGDIAITSDDDLSGVFLSLETTMHEEDRGNGRYVRRLPVRIVAGDISIQTKTIDVSTNGVRIEDMLPEGLPRYFNVELQTYKGPLSMVCSAVRLDAGPTNRLKIEINEFPEILQALLIAG